MTRLATRPAVRSVGRPRPPLALLLGALALYTLRFGVGWGGGDHDELVPSALALLDPSLFPRDWLIQTVTDGVNVRTPFVWLLSFLGRHLPLAVAGTILHVIVWLGTAAGIWALGWAITRSRLAAGIGTVLALVVTVAFPVGSNALVANAALPEGIAWMLLVPAMAQFWERRWARAGALIGVAAWFHLLAAGLMGVALGSVVLLGIARRRADGDRSRRGVEDQNLVTQQASRTPIRDLPQVEDVATVERQAARSRRVGPGVADALRFGVPAILLALPMLIPVVLDQAAATADPSGPDPVWIHAVFRNAWHHLPGTFGLGLWTKFGVTMAVGGAAWVALRRAGRIRGDVDVLAFWAVAAAFFAVGALGTLPDVPVSLVAKLQPFKLAVPSVLLATICFAGWLAARAPSAVRDRLRVWATRRPAVRDGLALVAVGALAAFGVADGGPLRSRVQPLAHPATPLGQIETWARTETPTDALFAVPPTASTFRNYARRSVVITWNGFVFGDAEMQTWYARLQSVAPVESVRGVDPKPALDSSYAARSAADWRALRERYGIDYVVMSAPSALPFPVAHRADGWTVYRLGEALSFETENAPPDESSGAQVLAASSR